MHDEAEPRSLRNNSALAIAEERSGVFWIGTTVTVMWSAQPS